VPSRRAFGSSDEVEASLTDFVGGRVINAAEGYIQLAATRRTRRTRCS
jgi:hypothetical protein